MIDTIFHILHHTIEDTWLMLPLLYLTYLVIEYFERKENNDDRLFFSLQKYGPLVGAFIGIIPQCGFSIIASMLFMQNNITLGTLISVFIATSDEAIPILIANPELYSSLIWVIVLKIVIAIIAGYFIDYVIEKHQKIDRFEDMEEDNSEEEIESSGSSCPCCYPQYPMAISALLRSLKIFAFLFITSFVLGAIIEVIGEENLELFLLNGSLLQPLFAALFGFIPNCAASVVLTQLYVAHGISFASLLAGLITNAGLGLLVLIRYQVEKKQCLKIIMLLYFSAVIPTILLQFFM